MIQSERSLLETMNYIEIESLVISAKAGDEKAKEILAVKFTPLITSISKKSFINSYDFGDVKNECYKTLFNCIQLYDKDRHRFVAYATNAIKNSIRHLIRMSHKNYGTNRQVSLSVDTNLENVITLDMDCNDDMFIIECYKSRLNSALNSLHPEEQKLITYVFFKGYSLKRYSVLTGMNYYALLRQKNDILYTLKKLIN